MQQAKEAAERGAEMPEVVPASPPSTLEGRIGWQVVHGIPGRLRLRANSPTLVAEMDAFAKQLRSLNSVGEVRTNKQARSLVITFDPNTLSRPQMLEVLQEYGVLILPAVSSVEKQTEPLTVWQSPEFWQEQVVSLIPLIAGLLVTRGLGFNGWRAILVYIIAASTTRQVIDLYHVDGEDTNGRPH